MSKYSKYINRLFEVLFTAAPGLIKAITFTVLFWGLKKEEYANFALIYSNSIIVGLVGGVGIGTVIIKNRAPVKKTPIYLLFSFVISIPVFTYFYFVSNDSFGKFLLISIGVLVNQISRFYVISTSSFLYGGRFEIINLILTTLLLSIIPNEFALVIFFVYLLNILFILKMRNLKEEDDAAISIKNDISSALTIGYTSLISSGIVFMFPSITASWGNDDLVSSLGLILGVIGIISVVPRSVLNNKLKMINESLINKDFIVFKAESTFIKKTTNKIILPSVVILVFYVIIQLQSFSLDVIAFLVSISFFVYVGQYSLVESNVVNFIGKEKLSLLSNLTIFLVFIGMAKLSQCFIENGFVGMTSICLLCALCYYVRMEFFRYLIRRYMEL